MLVLHFQMMSFGHLKGLLDCNHEHIHMKWVAYLNDSNEQLVNIVNGEKLWAMHNDLVLKLRIVVIQDSFQILISRMKIECSNKVLQLF
jgi:hypothetical protein